MCDTIFTSLRRYISLDRINLQRRSLDVWVQSCYHCWSARSVSWLSGFIALMGAIPYCICAIAFRNSGRWCFMGLSHDSARLESHFLLVAHGCKVRSPVWKKDNEASNTFGYVRAIPVRPGVPGLAKPKPLGIQPKSISDEILFSLVVFICY